VERGESKRGRDVHLTARVRDLEFPPQLLSVDGRGHVQQPICASAVVPQLMREDGIGSRGRSVPSHASQVHSLVALTLGELLEAIPAIDDPINS
jgi:hypothetical protein